MSNPRRIPAISRCRSSSTGSLGYATQTFFWSFCSTTTSFSASNWHRRTFCHCGNAELTCRPNVVRPVWSYNHTVAGGILPFRKKRNVESRLPVFDHPDIKLDSKNSNLQKEVWTKQPALKKRSALKRAMSLASTNPH
ncbi:hypothetical protein WJX77_004358 [Trebouxia sp. C0004]